MEKRVKISGNKKTCQRSKKKKKKKKKKKYSGNKVNTSRNEKTPL